MLVYIRLEIVASQRLWVLACESFYKGICQATTVALVGFQLKTSECHSLALGQQLNNCSLVGCIGLQRGLTVLGKQLFVILWSLKMASCIR